MLAPRLRTAVVGYLLFALRQRTAASPLTDLGLLFRRPVFAGVFVIGIATALMPPEPETRTTPRAQ